MAIAIENGYLKYYHNDEHQYSFNLSEVKEIFAFKRDIFAVDLICLGFRTDESGSYCEIDEQMDNYNECLSQLHQYFSGFNKEWFCKVAFPPFETNCTTIWGKSFIPEFWSKA